jgi:hypothetical protein
VLTYEALADGVTSDDLIGRILDQVPVALVIGPNDTPGTVTLAKLQQQC